MKNSKSDRIKAAAHRALEEAHNRKKELEETKLDLEKCKSEFMKNWDNTEFYFTADEFVAYLLKNNIKSKYSQISSCAGIYEIKS